MYGYKARIGAIIPSTNTVLESEYNIMKPEGVSVHTARMMLTTTNAQTLKRMSGSIEEEAEKLATTKCDVIVFGCTSGSFIGGQSYEQQIVDKIECVSGKKGITTAGAVSRALSVFEKHKVTVVTPYIEELNLLEKKFIESFGYKVVSIKGLGIDDNVTIGKNEPSAAYNLAKETVTNETEILFISCTDFRSIEIITTLEKELNVPVISSNQAAMWDALRSCNIRDNLLKYGSLFNY